MILLHITFVAQAGQIRQACERSPLAKARLAVSLPLFMEIFVLGSGSSGNTSIVRTQSTVLLIDAGLSAKKTLVRLASVGLAPADISAVLLTHEHGDHTDGLPVLLNHLHCEIFATRLTQEEVAGSDPRNAKAAWRLFSSGSSFEIGEFQVNAFSVPHDAADPVGFCLRAGQLSLGVVTDLGHANNSVVHHLAGVDALFVEANHDEDMLRADRKRPMQIKQRIMSPHGHLSNRAAGELARKISTEKLASVVLGHLSRDCNTRDLAIETVQRHLPGNLNVAVSCAQQDDILHCILEA